MFNFLKKDTDKKDVTLIPLSDFQTGSSTALHPNVKKINGKWTSLEELQGWRYRNNPHYLLNDRQIRIWNHLNLCLERAAEVRKNKKMILLMVGDAIDGDHHGTHELVTRNIGEQKSTHVQLFQYIQEKLDYQRGDMLAYIDGTFIHVGDEEDSLGEQLGAYQYSDGSYSAAFLEMDINGAWIWAYHKGVSAGQGHTSGNACINMLKRIYYQCLDNGQRVPDLIITGHTHTPFHATWTTPRGQTMHYVILPSWQDKTRFVKDNLATHINKVGMQIINISGAGEITVFDPLVMSAPLGERITI